MKIKAGTILTLEHGEYSDYGFDGPFRVLKDFDQADVVEAFRAQFTPEADSYSKDPGRHDFMAWMARERYMEDIAEGHGWYIGAYGFEPEIQSVPEAI